MPSKTRKGIHTRSAFGKRSSILRQNGGIPIALLIRQWNTTVKKKDLYTEFIQSSRDKEDAIMKEGMKVKVIKKNEIKPQAKAVVAKSKRSAARTVVANVTNWVNDLQARKRDETKVAIEKFFSHQPQPSEL